MTRYELIDSPNNGTQGQSSGNLSYGDLPERIRTAIDADPEAGEWTLPALSEGDSGVEIDDLTTIVRRCAV